MTEPCHQEAIVRRLNSDIRVILKDIRDDQKSQTDLLAALCRQDERSKAHTDILARQDLSLDEAFLRIRNLEKAPGSTASRALWVMFGAGCSTVGAVVLLLLKEMVTV